MSNENRHGAARPEKFDAVKAEAARAIMRTVDTATWNMYIRAQEQPYTAQYVDASGPTPVMSEIQAGYTPVYRSPGALAVDSTLRAQQSSMESQEGYDLAA